LTSPDVDADVLQPTPSLVRSFFRHGAAYAASGLLTQGIAFLLFPFLAHVFVPDDFAIIDLITLVTVLVNMTIALEIAQGLGRHFADARSFAERRTYASTALVFTFSAYTVALVLAFMFLGPLTDIVLGSDVDTSIMGVAICAMWMSGMLYLMQSSLRWQLRPRAYGLVSVVTSTVTASTTAVLVLGFDIGVIGAIIGQLVGFTSGAVFAYSLSRDLFRIRFDRHKFQNMIGFSLPLVLSSVGVFLTSYADRLAIRSKLTLTDVGLYGVGYRMSFIVSLTLLGFQGSLMPLVVRHHEREQTRRDLEQIFRLFCAIALAVFLCVSLFADVLLRILTSPAYYSSAQVVPFLIAGSFLGGMYIFAPGMSIAKRTRPYVYVSVIAGVANVVLAFGLVVPMGIRGPALAFLITAGGSFAALMIVSQRSYHVAHAWRELLATALAIVALVAVGRSLFGGTVDVVAVLAEIALAGVGLALIATRLLKRAERVELVSFPRRSIRVLRSRL
jgi:O-antigen/teichoic acid export membrane protein